MRRFHKIDDAISDIKAGKIVIVVDDENRENEGDLIMAASKATPAKINFMAREGRGLICAPLSEDIADGLDLPPMVQNNTERVSTHFTVSVDLKSGTTTGISASDRAKTVRALADPKSRPDDFLRPGHIFPLMARRGGVLVRAGHTEAAVDLARLAGLAPVGVVCEIMKTDGSMARLPQLMDFSSRHKLKIISIKDLIAYRCRKETIVKRLALAAMPTDYGRFRLIAYKNASDSSEHLALVYGHVKGKSNVLVRIHSQCLTGESFASKRCDCGQQLEDSFHRITDEKAGVIVYLRQEGRGIGLGNKIRAYELQDSGYDTVKANRMLGFKADLREYGMAAHIIRELGIKSVRLMTNNPAKVQGLKNHGVEVVRRVPLEHRPNKNNRRYLETKKRLLGHILHYV
ncbi:MAG TPA: bifunctional 3,4-dihydroxy-2-butanone-4-phosphate synthase/GTP cyclohydrolase II [Candidatus Gracilibacteria bacterium]|nr:bifunctional 3,4-dihydroxy-2-butanone-4-phosphate synthase/GTP cyclohydrolase II [Candidatus Gracilibacteria bacterium]